MLGLTMKSHEVIREAVSAPGVKHVAAALKVSAGLVYKWCEPPASETPGESGARNPLDRVRDLYQATDDMRLIRWLCNESGGFFVANPDIAGAARPDETLFAQSRQLVRDFSALLDAVSASGQDDHIDHGEAELIRQRWEDLKANVERFVTACEGGHFRLKHRPPR